MEEDARDLDVQLVQNLGNYNKLCFTLELRLVEYSQWSYVGIGIAFMIMTLILYFSATVLSESRL